MPASFNKKYSFEDFIAELDAFMKANLGGYITQMITDKTDILLEVPSANAYFFQSLEGEVNYSPFVFYGETATETRANGPTEVNGFTLQVAIIMENSNQATGVLGKSLLRYRECLRAMFNQGWNGVNKRVKLEVSGISPFPFSFGTEPSHVGIGVNLQLEII